MIILNTKIEIGKITSSSLERVVWLKKEMRPKYALEYGSDTVCFVCAKTMSVSCLKLRF